MIATYRLQLSPDFGFSDAEAVIPYLKRLGISHLYLSPITEAKPGSTHGYDVVDHNAIREELGGREGFERLASAAREANLKIIVDFVPNHAGVGPRNAYWQDVLAYGPHSPYAAYFDIDWNPIKPELRNKILLPFLGRPYGQVLDDDEIILQYEDGHVYADYYENRYRLNPASYMGILEAAMDAAERTEPYWDLKDLYRSYGTLQPSERDKAEALRKRLTKLFERVDSSEVLQSFTGERLHALLERQFWRLSYWKTAGFEVNYRRFFDINGLVALRMEDDHVFWDAHQLLAEILAVDVVEGVRVDHIDGLFDPHDYLDRLRNVGAGRIWVEKILAPGETLPEDWPVDGTTGYEFMNDVMGLLLRKDGAIPLEKTCRRIVGPYPSFPDVAYQSKKFVIQTSLSSELYRLSYELDRISEADYHTRDFTLEAIRQALAEVVAVFDRYRTYLPYDVDTAREAIQLAVHRARMRNPVAEPTVYDFIASVVLGEIRDELVSQRSAWVGRFQQYTAPVAAKGVEDTAFYRYLPLTALNEVGGEPDQFGQSLHAFHSHARYRAHRFPFNLLATATHDHKRGEDTRMRLIGLAEIPDLWEETVRGLAAIGEDHTSESGPSIADQYFFFQTLVSVWADEGTESLAERLGTYMEKAARERKEQTSWTNPDPVYEEALQRFVRGILEDDRTPEAVAALTAEIRRIGFFNTLSQTVLKMTLPGIPDVYQGCELMDLSLVDPDNRRPVDYEHRNDLLDEIGALIEQPDADRIQAFIEACDERAKLFFTTALLRLRGRRPELFQGDYLPLETEEDGHVLGYLRSEAGLALLVVVPRYSSDFARDGLPAIELPEDFVNRSWTDVLGGGRMDIQQELDLGDAALPWVVLLSEGTSAG